MKKMEKLLLRSRARLQDLDDDEDEDEEESETSSDEEGYETAEDTFISEEEFSFPKSKLFDDEETEDNESPVPIDKIIKRIDSHKGMKSYQLGHQLHSRWTTGACPRISFMRDYPSELQCKVLEEAQLSPRSSSSCSQSPRTPARQGLSLGRSPLAPEDKPVSHLQKCSKH